MNLLKSKESKKILLLVAILASITIAVLVIAFVIIEINSIDGQNNGTG